MIGGGHWLWGRGDATAGGRESQNDPNHNAPQSLRRRDCAGTLRLMAKWGLDFREMRCFHDPISASNSLGIEDIPVLIVLENTTTIARVSRNRLLRLGTFDSNRQLIGQIV